MDAADDLLFLRALPWSANRSRLSGRVSLRLARSHVVAGAVVQIRSGGKLMETLTNADGVYEFYELAPGRYGVEIVVPKGHKVGFRMVSGGNASEILMGAANGVSVDFDLIEENTVSGRVLDPLGRPMRGVCMEFEAATEAGKGNVRASTCSKDDGTFRIADLPAGEYRGVANRRGTITGQTPFGTVYYPGTEEVSKAAVVKVSAGEKIENLEFRIPKVAGRITFSGRVQHLDGVPGARAYLKSWVGTNGEIVGMSAADGSFSFPVLAGAPVRIYAELDVFFDLLRDCPGFRGTARAKLGSAVLRSQEVFVAGDGDMAGVMMTLPAKSCGRP